MRSRRTLSQVTCLLISTLAAGACPTPPTGSESSSDSSSEPQTGDPSTTADCPVGSENCPCTGGGVCDPGLMCSADKICVDAGTTTTSVDTSTSTTMNVSGSTGTTDEDTSTTGGGPCDPDQGWLSAQCMGIDADRPFCGAGGVCGDCTVLPPDGCATLYPGTPICNPSDGKCVECTVNDQAMCGDNKPACNPDTNACEGCFMHSHCPDSACDLIARQCMPTDRVLHVRLGLPGDPDNVCTDKLEGTAGSEQNPFCFVDYAIMRAQKDGFTSGWTFKFLKTSWSESYHPGVTLVGDGQTELRYAFVHEPAAFVGDYNMSFRDVGVLFNAGINVTVFIDNFFFEAINPPADSAGVQCQQGGRIFLDNSYVHKTRGPGVRSLGCEVWVRNSTIYKGWTEGIDITDGKLHLINSYVTENSFFNEKLGGGIAATNSTLDIVYSAILNNNNELGKGGDSIDCRDEQVKGVIRNSVIGRTPMGNNLSIKCGANNLSVINSVHDSDVFAQDNHKLAGETILSYFVPDLETGAYPITPDVKTRPKAIMTLKDKAVWKKGDPWVDYDGDARPGIDGAIDFAGAEVVPGINP